MTNTLQELLPALLGALMGTLISVLLTWRVALSWLPTSHRVAIIGFPQIGKTTLITAVFDFLFRHGARGGSVVPRGDETIKRINENLRQLELRRSIRPTTDQDTFAYRADVTAGRFRRRYKLEIGDFPGEDTVSFIEEFGEWLHDTPYFQWASSADAFVFVIDTGAVLLDDSGEYVARQKSAFRAAWQRLQEHHLDGARDLATKPMLLVFAKADLLLYEPSELREMEALGYGTRQPETRVISQTEIETAAGEVLRRFQDLTEYFSQESRRFRTILTSAFATVGNERLGIPELAWRVLPRPNWFPSLASAGRGVRESGE